jgi:hypothetical protein
MTPFGIEPVTFGFVVQCLKNFEGADVLNSTVEKNGQIIHEQRVNRGQEPNEDKLPSK